MTEASQAEPKKLRVRTIAPHRDTSSAEGRVDRQVGDVYEIDELRAAERVSLGMVAIMPDDAELTDAPPLPDIPPADDAGTELTASETEPVTTSDITPPAAEQAPPPDAPPEES